MDRLLCVEEAESAKAVVESGWLSQGEKVAEFERTVAEYCETKHAVAVPSCTAALHMALVAVGAGPGDEIICPSLSFIATANAIRLAGATPVFADVNPLTYSLEPQAVKAAITSRAKAVLAVHQIGLPADMDRLRAVADEHGIKLVEDAACALGSRYKGRRIGPIGEHSEVACFSFHPRKVITTGEGGILTTDNAAHAELFRLLRQHGMSVPGTVRHASRKVIIEDYLCPGYNYRMTDMQAAEDVAYLNLDFGDGLLASFHVSWLSPVKVRHFIVGGREKSVVYDDLHPSEKIKVYDRGITVAEDPEARRRALVGYRRGDMWSPQVDSKEPLQRVVEHFAACVHNGERPLTDGEAGLRVVRMLDAAQRSIKAQGRRITL